MKIKTLFWISDSWLHFLHPIASPKGLENLEWPVPFPFYKNFCNRYIIGHRTSSEIQSTFPSSPSYKTMDPHFLQKKKKQKTKNKPASFQEKNTANNIGLFRDKYREEICHRALAAHFWKWKLDLWEKWVENDLSFWKVSYKLWKFEVTASHLKRNCCKTQS